VSNSSNTVKEMPASARPCCAWKLAAALVLLRLCVGWHFFSEGVKKISYDRSTGEWELNFSAEGFFRQAKGPLAGFFQNRIPGGHQWQAKLAVPEELTPARGDELARWVSGYVKRRQRELASGKHAEVEIPGFTPYVDWAAQIEADRRALHQRFTSVAGLTDEQRSQAAAVFERRQSQLADYLAGEALDIQAYRHELWRLENWQEAPGADGVPYQEQRIAQKRAETGRTPLKWVAAVREFDQEFAEELHGLLTDEQIAAAVGQQADLALTDPQETQLHWMNLAVAGLTIGVGGCLLLGLFTRLAATAGALFLATVMATQPPWVAGVDVTLFYYQLVELAALIFLAAAAAGRVAGLDFILHGLWSKCRGAKGSSR
jgi:uncharacterized membrane protein YphA (DoxX/SURF4 family)